MNSDPILEELWKVKDRISEEINSNPDLFYAQLEQRTQIEENQGRKVIRSAQELKEYVLELEQRKKSSSVP